MVLFGESHLAPSHLPARIRVLLPSDRLLTILQNLDTLYWKAAGERKAPVEAVRVAEDAICVFNATPLEKYESYRLYLERWRCERVQPDDLAPVFYNLIDALLRFLGVDKYKATRSGSAIVDCLPEVHSRRNETSFRKLLLRKGARLRAVESTLQQVREHGCAYVSRLNAVFATRLNLRRSAEVAAQFVLLACQGGIPREARQVVESSDADRFYSRTLDEALIYLGSRVLYPSRAPVREADYYPLYSHPREVVESCGLYSYREYLEMIDFLLLHKDYESRREQYGRTPQLIESGLQYDGPRFDYVTRELGLMLGSELYDAYVTGRIPKQSLRALFFRARRPAIPRRYTSNWSNGLPSRDGKWWHERSTSKSKSAALTEPMNAKSLKQLFDDVRRGKLSSDEAVQKAATSCPSKTSASPMSIIIARCASACPR